MYRPYLISTILILALLGVACNATPQPQPTFTPAPTSVPISSPAMATSTPEPASPTATALAPSTSDLEPSTSETASRGTRFVINPEKTIASYSIQETFIDQNNKLVTAVGKTNAVEGELTLNYDDPTASESGQFTVDISTLTSDRARRDNAIRQRWLESAQYPLATFVVNEVRNFPPDAQEGQPVQFQIVGDMTVKQTTREVTWDVTATLEGDLLSGTATTLIMLADFKVPAPSIAGILSVTDGATLTLDFSMQAVE